MTPFERERETNDAFHAAIRSVLDKFIADDVKILLDYFKFEEEVVKIELTLQWYTDCWVYNEVYFWDAKGDDQLEPYFTAHFPYTDFPKFYTSENEGLDHDEVYGWIGETLGVDLDLYSDYLAALNTNGVLWEKSNE